MTSSTPNPVWGDDKLSEFLQRVRNNQVATFTNISPAFDTLRDIDHCFVSVAENMEDPQGSDKLLQLLFRRSHAAYRAACGTSMAGQAPETFVLLRSCLEYSGYALLIHRDPDLALVWLRRHRNNCTYQEMRSKFQVTTIKNGVKSTSHALGIWYCDLYTKEQLTSGHIQIQKA